MVKGGQDAKSELVNKAATKKTKYFAEIVNSVTSTFTTGLTTELNTFTTGLTNELTTFTTELVNFTTGLNAELVTKLAAKEEELATLQNEFDRYREESKIDLCIKEIKCKVAEDELTATKADLIATEDELTATKAKFDAYIDRTTGFISTQLKRSVRYIISTGKSDERQFLINFINEPNGVQDFIDTRRGTMRRAMRKAQGYRCLTSRCDTTHVSAVGNCVMNYCFMCLKSLRRDIEELGVKDANEMLVSSIRSATMIWGDE